MEKRNYPRMENRTYCPDCKEFTFRRPFFASKMEAKFCPFCGGRVRNVGRDLKNAGLVDLGELSTRVKGYLKRNYIIKTEVELEGGFKISAQRGFVERELAEEAKSEVLDFAKSRPRYEKAGETREEVAIIREGKPLFYRKERKVGKISRKKFFKIDQLSVWKGTDTGILYDNDGFLFARRMGEKEASTEIRSKAMAAALKKD